MEDEIIAFTTGLLTIVALYERHGVLNQRQRGCLFNSFLG